MPSGPAEAVSQETASAADDLRAESAAWEDYDSARMEYLAALEEVEALRGELEEARSRVQAVQGRLEEGRRQLLSDRKALKDRAAALEAAFSKRK